MRRSGRRLWAQILLLPILYLTSLPDPGLYTGVIFFLAFVTLPVNLVVAGVLEWSSRQAPDIETLRERADDSWTLVLMSAATSGTAFVAILIRAGFEFPGRPSLAILSWLAILIVVPAVGWMVTWRDRWMPAIRKRLADREEAEAGQDA